MLPAHTRWICADGKLSLTCQSMDVTLREHGGQLAIFGRITQRITPTSLRTVRVIAVRELIIQCKPYTV